MPPPDRHAVTAALVDARRSARRAAAAPLAEALADADAAYAVQAGVAAALGLAPGRPAAWKSGGASLDAMTHAPLPGAGVWASPATLPAGWPVAMRVIEAEIALRLAVDVDAARAASIGPADAAALVDAMAVSIELVESRWLEGLDAPALLKLADLQSHGALVLGAWVPLDARDWSAQRCVARLGAQAIERTGTHPLKAPTAVLGPWLRHATRDGATVAAGSVVTTGTWIGTPAAAAGDLVVVEFDGVGEARLQL